MKHFEKVTPESLGIRSESIAEFVDNVRKDGLELHSFSVLRHGKLCAEGYVKPYNPETPSIMFSFSKTLTATAIGFAVQEGVLSLNEKLVDLFPDEIPEDPSENLKQADIYSLLTMSCGHAVEMPYDLTDENWVRTFLHHEFVYPPRTMFQYNTAGSNMLAEILRRRTGLQVTEYLKPRLFDKIGMSDIKGSYLPNGTVMGGSGMFLTTEDQALFGQFLLNKGSWNGEQLLNADWIELASKKHIETRNEIYDAIQPNWLVGYGFQCWRCVPEGVWRCDGAYGQFAVIFTKEDAVVTIKSASKMTDRFLQDLFDTVQNSMQDEPYPENPAAVAALEEKLEAMEMQSVWGIRARDPETAVNGTVYRAEGEKHAFIDLVGGAGLTVPHENLVNSIRVRFGRRSMFLDIEGTNQTQTLEIALDGSICMQPFEDTIVGSSGRWETVDSMLLEIRNARSAIGARIKAVFTEEGLSLIRYNSVPEITRIRDCGINEMYLKKV